VVTVEKVGVGNSAKYKVVLYYEYYILFFQIEMAVQ
jgi:hypothetical protein